MSELTLPDAARSNTVKQLYCRNRGNLKCKYMLFLVQISMQMHTMDDEERDLLAKLEVLRALQNARMETEGALRDLNAQRQHVARPNTPNLEFPAADETLLRQLMKVRGYTYHRGVRVGWFSPTDGPQQLRIIAGAPGMAVPQPGRESVAA